MDISSLLSWNIADAGMILAWAVPMFLLGIFCLIRFAKTGGEGNLIVGVICTFMSLMAGLGCSFNAMQHGTNDRVESFVKENYGIEMSSERIPFYEQESDMATEPQPVFAKKDGEKTMVQVYVVDDKVYAHELVGGVEYKEVQPVK